MPAGLFGRGKRMHPALEKNHSHFEHFDQDKSLKEYEFVVFDTELTGLNVRTNEIVSIGAVRIRKLRIMAGDIFYTRVHPEKHMPKETTLIHRLTPEKVEDAPSLKDALLAFIEYAGGALFVGHSVGIDAAFVNRASKRILGDKLKNPCIDTMRLAKSYREEKWGSYYDKFDLNVSYNLGDLAKEYGLPTFPQHNALNDAMQTAYLFVYLVHKLGSSKVETLRDLYLAGKSQGFIF